MAKQIENQKQNLVLGRLVDKLNYLFVNPLVQTIYQNIRRKSRQ